MTQNCNTCQNWIDATAECIKQLSFEANGIEISESMIDALDLDSDAQNDCEFFEN